MTESDIKIIINKAIDGDDSSFNKFFEDVFVKLHSKLNALTNSEDDTNDIYLMSMQKFWERFVINQKKLPHNTIGYIYIMCKNAWLLQKRMSWETVILSSNPEEYCKNTTSNTSENEDKSNHELIQHKALTIALEELSPKCKTLIEVELDNQIKLKDLQDELGYTNYQALVQAKYNCKKRLIKKVNEILSNLKTGKSNIK